MTDVWIGLANVFTLEPAVPEVRDRQGNTEGRLKRYRGARVLVQEARNLVVTSENGDRVILDKGTTEDSVTEEWIKVNMVSRQSNTQSLSFTTAKASAIEITAISLDCEFDGRD